MDSENEKIPELLEAFLDAESTKAKLELLEEHQDEIDERMISNIEASLDLPGGSGSLEQRIDYVCWYLRTRGRFETGGSRLR